MHLKPLILFLIAILGVFVLGGLLFGVSILKERWEPRITYIGTLPVDPGKTEFTFGGGGYVNQRIDYYYLIYTSWSAKRFKVVIESFSEELQVLHRNNRVVAPYVLQEGNLPDERCIWLSFTVIMPNQTGSYKLDLCIRLYGWLFFSIEYKWKYMLTAKIFVPKPLPEECLSITLDKEIYHQGDVMTITIENISNETIWFTDTACNLFFERFNGEYWEFYDAMVGGLAMTPLEPSETKRFIWKLGYAGRPYPSGHYRVGTKGVYTEFEVIESELSQAELEKIVIEFLKTTDVPGGGWDGTVEVKEIYDHKLGGKVMVVKYTTANAGHPGFFLEAIEHHIAVITLNMGREVVSAFCVWGNFHNGKIWDLLNQRWIQQAIISEQQASSMA